MRVAITGSSGLIGQALIRALEQRGDTVTRVVRRDPGPDDVLWDPTAGTVAAGALEGIDAVVHLAGEGVAEKRWNPEQKRRILESRSKGTTTISTALAGLARKPAVLVSASAIGYYGDRGDETLTEESPPGTGFLVDVVTQWEASTAPAEEAGIRVVRVRTGIVLSGKGGALDPQLPLFRLGLGGRLGSGKQYVSWISIDDEIGAILHAIDNASVSGALNAVGPKAVTNAEFTKALGRAVHRPAVLAIPKLALDVRLGKELATELLKSQRVVPAKLQATGYTFKHADIDTALNAVLG